jgi:hypothetical protein
VPSDATISFTKERHHLVEKAKVCGLDGDQKCGLENMALNSKPKETTGNFLSRRGNVTFSRMTSLRAASYLISAKQLSVYVCVRVIYVAGTHKQHK